MDKSDNSRDLVVKYRLLGYARERVYLPLFNNYNIMRHSQNLPLLPRIHPPFQQLYATLPESIPPSQNISPFSTTMCDPPRIYPSLQGHTPLFNSYMTPSKKFPPPLPESPSPFVTNLFVRPSQKSTPPSQNMTLFSTTICDSPRIHPSLPECTPPLRIYPPPFSTNICDIPRIYPSCSHWICPFSRTICERIYHLFPELKNILEGGVDSGTQGGSLYKFVKNGGIFWEGGVDSGRVAHINLLKSGV